MVEHTLLLNTLETASKEYLKWKNMDLFISGMTVNTNDTTSGVDGVILKMAIYVVQHG